MIVIATHPSQRAKSNPGFFAFFKVIHTISHADDLKPLPLLIIDDPHILKKLVSLFKANAPAQAFGHVAFYPSCWGSLSVTLS